MSERMKKLLARFRAGADASPGEGDDPDSMRKVCGNCRNNYRDGDRYCRYCGAPMGSPVYLNVEYGTIYGPPPVKRTHTCGRCGYKWNTNLMIDREQWCPKCGGKAPVTSEDNPWM